MEDSRLPDLKRYTKQIVREAHQPGGLIDQGEFTIAVARRQITKSLGLEEGSLDGKPWKQVVKEEVTRVMDELEEEGDESGPSRSASPEVKETSKAKDKAKPKPNVKASKPESKNQDKVDKKVKTSSPPKTSVPAKVDNDDKGDESDMSSVYDEAPTKRRKKAEANSDKVEGKKRTKKDPDEGLSPDEARVAELKRLVVACGVRKQWSKEFAECPTSSSQIRHLQSLLSSLGMKGTPTLGKAKKLKEKRELAAELDDVHEFEAKRGVGQEGDGEEEEITETRASRSKAGRKSEEVVEEVDEEDQEEVRDKKSSALSSILDFLGDQSD